MVISLAKRHSKTNRKELCSQKFILNVIDGRLYINEYLFKGYPSNFYKLDLLVAEKRDGLTVTKYGERYVEDGYSQSHDDVAQDPCIRFGPACLVARTY